MSKKRVFDKDLGVELVLDDDIGDSSNKSNFNESSKKKPRFDLNQSSSNQRLSNTSQQAHSESTINHLNLQENIKWPSGINDEADEDVEDSDNENFEDIDYGDDDAEFNTEFASQIDMSNSPARRSTDGNDRDDEYKMFKRKRRLGNTEDNKDDDLAKDEEQGERVENNEEHDTAKESAERCRYWPSCNAGDDCSYYHPTKQCRAFPNCRFGNKCLYIHPPCKFNPNCTRPACPFAHPLSVSSSNRTGHGHFRAVQLPQPPKCKYGFKCNNVFCKFSHQRSEPCRFGANCLLEDCPYTHPSDVARKKPASAFKWQASD